MSSWSQFCAAAPTLADFGKSRLEYRIAYLATIRPDGSPRLHPVSPFIANDDLFIYMYATSPKGNDLRRDARYTLHCGVEDNEGGQGEFFVRGRAIEITDREEKESVFEHARRAGYTPEEKNVLFEFRVEEAMATVYGDGETKRTRWREE